MKKISFIPVAMALALLTSACSSQIDTTDPAPVAEKEIAVTVISLAKERQSSAIQASGYFTTDDETILSFKIGGIVNAVLVREGDYVRKGQVLATLDITEIQAQVRQAELGLEKAKRDFERAERLYKDSVATRETLENARTGLDIATQQVNAARFNLGTTSIKAPGNGYVLRKFVQTGQVVGPGTPILLTNSPGSSQWLLKVSLSDKDWGRVKINDRAEIAIDAGGSQTLPAYVSHKLEGADPSSGAFTIELRLKNSAPASLAAGLYGKASVFPTEQTEFWSIPYEALLEGEGKTGYVFVTEDGKTAKKQIVTLAGITREKALISSGIDENTSLIVAGSAFLKDGSPIRIIEPGKPSEQ